MDQSRAPHQHPWKTPREVEDLIIRARKKRPTWGPVTLKDWLEAEVEGLELPSARTVGRILRRYGLSKKRHRRRRTPPCDVPLSHCQRPNDVWSVDFKGQFSTQDGAKCYPLTIMDGHSRFLLRCEGLTSTAVRTAFSGFESAFSEYGLPVAIRSDNGSPFASTGAGGLTELSAWWHKLGIHHERIEPGHPEQNGRHERMHRTLKAEAISPPRASPRAQQRAFDLFRKRYNEDRPHQALGGRRPAEVYLSSQKELPEKTPRIVYEWDQDVVRLDKRGAAVWRRRKVPISTALSHEEVAFEAIGPTCWEVYFGRIILGVYDLSQPRRGLTPPRKQWRKVSTM